MVVRMRFTADQTDMVGTQCCRRIERDIVAEAFADRDFDAQLLGQFAGQRLGLGLTGPDLAARQFPAARQLGRPQALCDQHPGFGDDGAGDHDLVRHRGDGIRSRGGCVSEYHLRARTSPGFLAIQKAPTKWPGLSASDRQNSDGTVPNRKLAPVSVRVELSPKMPAKSKLPGSLRLAPAEASLP